MSAAALAREGGQPDLMTAREFAQTTGVSRETLERLSLLRDLITEWQSRVNLIGRATFRDIWRRHFLDSAQLVGMAPRDATWLDIGSGAGFPGLVVAICAGARVHLVEADSRKCAFLREAALRTDAPVEVHNARIEDLGPVGAGVITARAVAPLRRLLDLCSRHIGPSTLCLFPKGRSVGSELTEASKYWKLSLETVESVSDPSGRILRIKGVVPWTPLKKPPRPPRVRGAG